MSFQQMSTKMAPASATVRVPTTELILQKLQYFKLVFSRNYDLCNILDHFSKSSAAYHPCQLQMLKIVRFRAGNGPTPFNLKLTKHHIRAEFNFHECRPKADSTQWALYSSCCFPLSVRALSTALQSLKLRLVPLFPWGLIPLQGFTAVLCHWCIPATSLPGLVPFHF